jgi:uncharacterized protein (DUF2384 family)
MRQVISQTAPQSQAAGVLTRAVLRASEILGLSHKDLAGVLGVSPASLSRIGKGSRVIDPRSKEGEIAVLFLRVFRSLDALMGGSQEKSRKWLHAENVHLGEAPVRLIETVPGLVHVVEYLDAMRGNL